MEQSVIAKLYNGEDPLCESTEPNSEEYRQYAHQKESEEKRIKALLGEENAEIFEEYIRTAVHVSGMIEEEAFRRGVCIGIKLMMEAIED